MRGYVNGRTFVVFLAAGLLTCGVANAQYTADFEAPTYTGSAEGVDIWGQDAFYNPAPPDTETITAYVYTYLDNALGIVENPFGGDEQFVAGRGPGSNTYSRAQRDITWGTGVWTVWYDVAALWLPDDPNGAAANNVGSFSSQLYPGEATYIHLFSWIPGQEGVLWRAFYLAYDASGVAHSQPGQSPGPEWDNLVLNHWYRFSTTLDYGLNRITEVSITDTAPCAADVDGDGDTDLNDLAALLTAYGSSVGQPNYNPAADFDNDQDVDLADLAFLLSGYGCVPTPVTTTAYPTEWYMEGGQAGGLPLPSGFRLFAGGGEPGNTVAWDNLSIAP